MKCTWCGVDDETVSEKVYNRKFTTFLGTLEVPAKQILCSECYKFWKANLYTCCATGTSKFIKKRKKEVSHG